MTLEEMRQRKQELGYSVSDLARLSGVPQPTLQKIFSGTTKTPRHDTMEKLAAVLGRPKPVKYSSIHFSTDHVADAVPAYGSAKKEVDNPYGNKMQGEYTIEDYLALPDDKRYELIDGVIYEMSSPTSNHQDLVTYLGYLFWSCVEQHHLPCHPFVAPLDVQLDKDNKTMVQPDVIVVCDSSQNIGKRIFGAPDFAAEILSPSTRGRDLFLKLNKYRNAGVREYWLIDPDKKTVVVYLFCKNDDMTTYTFDDEIPVFISDGLCSVSFAALEKWMV